MKKSAAIALAAVTLILAYSQPGHAHYYRGGIWVGPAYGPWWYPPPPVVVRQEPVVVVRQEPVEYVHQEPQPQEQYWYYCPAQKGYYPYVKECPTGWTKVAPTPPPQ